MRKRTYIRMLAISLLAGLVMACTKDDTFVSGLDTREGVPCTVTLNIGAAPAPEITITRADNTLGRPLSMVIFVYDASGTVCQNVVELASDEIAANGTYNGTNSNGETLYKVQIKTTSGEKQLLAVANYGSPLWDTATFTELRQEANDGTLSLEDLRDGVMTLSSDNVNDDGDLNILSITGSNQMLISGWNAGVKFATDGTVANYGTYGDANGSVVLKMQRSMARITFNIAAAPTGADGTFVPTTFRVYNIPMNAYLATDNDLATTGRTSDEINTTTYMKSASTNVGGVSGGNYSFSFYMPENVQEAGKNTGDDYANRDLWNYGGDQPTTEGDGALPEAKIWTNAPQNSTFVVINGSYVSNDGKYTGNVNYTVHLGDFSDTGSMDNFSVERNYAYTYNMQVLGVYKIVVEAQKGTGDYQQGAEGEIYDAENCVYNYQLDAHFEQVYLEYNLSDIAEGLGTYNTDEELDEAIANKMILVIQSEAMDHNAGGVANKRGSVKPYQIYADAIRNGATDDGAAAKAEIMEGAGSQGVPTKGFDYKWVEFWPQDGTTLVSYPGTPTWSHAYSSTSAFRPTGNQITEAGYLKDVYDVIVAMGKVVKKIYNNGNKNGTPDTSARGEDGITITRSGNDYVARFTVFVNEYYYYKHPLTNENLTMWSVLTNKIPREMIIAMSTETSTDGNSSYSQIYSYISQLSMQTLYNSRVANINGFGIETYNETPLTLAFGEPSINGTLDDSDGRSNQIRLLNQAPGGSSSTYGNWSTYINDAYNGWTSTVTADHTYHKLNEEAYQEQVTYWNADRYAYYACMSRNRDLNGNGVIDDNEVRWYLASLNEYIRMGIGAGAISNAAQLYIGDKAAMQKSLYPNSYINLGSLFYTSSSSDKRVYWAVERGSYGGGYTDTALPIRCVRVLPAIGGQQTAETVNGVEAVPTVEKKEYNGMIVLDFRDRLMNDLYRQYVEGSLGVHNEDSDENSFYNGIFVAEDYLPDTYRLDRIIGYNTPMVNPCATYNEGGYTNWRVPNLVELSAMNAVGLLNDMTNTVSTNNALCATQFSNLNVRYGFARSSLIFCPGANGDEFRSEYKIRCVRDIPEDVLNQIQ